MLKHVAMKGESSNKKAIGKGDDNLHNRSSNVRISEVHSNYKTYFNFKLLRWLGIRNDDGILMRLEWLLNAAHRDDLERNLMGMPALEQNKRDSTC